MTAPPNIFAADGAAIPVGSNQPFEIEDASQVWFVAAGRVDVFAVAGAAALGTGARTHLLRVEAEGVIFGWGASPDATLPRFLAVGDNETRVFRLPLERVRRLGGETVGQDAMSGWIDGWVEAVYQGLAGAPAPTDAQVARDGETIHLSGGASVRPDDCVLWAQPSEGGLFLAGLDQLGLAADAGRWPVSPAGWLAALADTKVSFVQTRVGRAGAGFWEDFARFHALARRWAAVHLEELRRRGAERLAAKTEAEQRVLRSAVGHLSTLFLSRRQRDVVAAQAEDPLVFAVQMVAQALGVPFAAPPSSQRLRSRRDAVVQLARVSRLRTRRVVLSGEWWRQDSGPLLAFHKDSTRPVALLPRSAGSYELADPMDGHRVPVDERLAATLSPMAVAFYPAFGDRALKVWEVFKFGFQGVRADLVMVMTLTLAGVLLGLVVPIVTGLIFDQVIPSADRRQLWFLAAALAVTAFTEIMLSVTYSIAMVRVETKSETTLQAAVWDRLLRLPLPFFRKYTAGDLADRAQGVNTIRQILSGAMMGSLLSGVFSSLSFALLCYYSLRLTLVACGLVAINLAATALVSVVSLRLERPVYAIAGRLSGQVLQFITGIAKLRVAGAEAHAFEVWARDFGRFKSLDLRVQRLGNLFAVFQDVFPLATSMVLFAAMTSIVGEELSIGKFLAFSAAFMTFLHSTIGASGALLSLIGAIPVYERTKPILDAVPEVTENKADPGLLLGKIELSHVNFRYQPGEPLVLQDLSLQIQPGEFVAVVGPSGSGKSTLLRLLLGFEKPDSGTIYFDGLDLAGLDIQAVRRQFGVVLQNGKLMPGDLFRNIVGTSLLTLDDAWEAARLAGLEEDIREMPMGMHTVLGEGSSTLSGGQRQRLMIARAIVNKPRILLFDEATSALDNRTQAIVSRSLENLKATRLVIAHRLSTIQSADRIHVIEKGRLVQSGTFRELSAQTGAFAALMQRQIT
jgi:NHLM bacteriocin system ABC transporter ATP-binding protein